MIKIVFPDYPVKIALSKSRRKKFFTEDDKIPKKYQGEGFIFKKGRLYDVANKSFVIKNLAFVDKPRYHPLSYNKISTRLKVPILIALKGWMEQYMPSSLVLDGPYRIHAEVYDWPIPMNKDLDNMHIYYKAFLDLLKQRGLIKDDSKRFVTQAGGFTYIPVYNEGERKMVFIIERDDRPIIQQSIMYNLLPKAVIRGRPTGVELRDWKDGEPGRLQYIGGVLLMNFGKTKVIKAHADKLFRAVYEYCINHNTECWVSPEFYRIHADRIQRFLLEAGIQVVINNHDA